LLPSIAADQGLEMAKAMSGSSTADGQSKKAFSATKNVLWLMCLM